VIAGPLHPEGWADCQKSGLTIETIDRCGIASVPPQRLSACGIPVTHATEFPYHSSDGTAAGFARWKLFYAGHAGDRPKYWQPKGTDPLLYLPRLVEWHTIASDPQKPITVTEGEKKSLAACQLGLPCIGVAGVWNWRTKLDDGERMALPGLDQFSWKSRTVELIPDSDAWRPEKERDILAGFYALGHELKGRGAFVSFVELPEYNGVKCGLDDFIVRAGAFPFETFQGCKRYALDHPRFKALSAWHQKWERRQRGGNQGLVKTLADEILKTEHFAKDAGGEIFAFEAGVYRPRGSERIAQCVKRLLDLNGDSARWSSHLAREVTEYIQIDAPALWERPRPDTLNLRNGLLDILTGTLRPHEPEHLSSIQLPVAFDPGATCPQWETFITRVFPEDCRNLAFEIAASAMRGDVGDQKAILFQGSGENGKSVYLDGLVAFLGRENVSSLALQRLEVDKFSVVRLLGKLANVCADLPADHLASTSTFKALTGGDILTGERKFQGSFEFVSFARLIFSTNHYPQSKDASHAFFRRWHVVPFDAVIDPRERIPNLAARLAEVRELSGVLNRVLAVLPGMIQRGGFSQSETTQAAMMEFREMTDPLAAWLDRCTVLSPERMVSRKDLLISYNAQAEASGRPALTSKAFCQAIRRLRPTIEEAQRTVCGAMQWVFLGLGLAASPPASSHDSHHSHDFSQISLEVRAEREEAGKSLKIGNGVIGVSGLKPPEASIVPCFTCHASRFWRSIHGAMVCGTCHPPMNPDLVTEWIGNESAR
jgi:P4 family phage/plasmid primase-like protien